MYSSPSKEFTVNGVTFKMIKVDGGTFKMGSPEEEHPVTVDDFYIGEIEVTNELKNAVLNTSGEDSNYAVNNFTWSNAQSFMNSLSIAAGAGFRFPTEAEWEYAARGGKLTRGYKGSGFDGNENTTYGYHPSRPQVKQSHMNELGIWDMSGGGVGEWCYDNFKGYDREAVINPTGPETGNYKVKRGGWYSDSARTVGERSSGGISYIDKSNGLRLASDYSGESPFLTVTVGSVSFNMIDVEGGEFIMGEDGDTHRVSLSSFSIGETEVTQELWEEVMGSNPSYMIGSQNPVERVSWNDCIDFITELNSRTGLNFRLPTEAEWEFAARGGNLSQGYIYSGSNTITDVARCTGNRPTSLNPEIKQKQPNELGLYDMSGLVWEVCSGDSDGYGLLKGGNKDSTAEECAIFNRKINRDYIFAGLRIVSDDPASLNLSGSGINMIFVQGGTYTKNGETITVNDFYIADAPITEQQYAHFVYGDDSIVSNEPATHFEDVYGAQDYFLDTLNSALGITIRVPTEEEWEFAALGGNLSHNYTYSGSNNINDVAWYYINTQFTTAPVKSYSPNELGIYDMTGNVWEWCQDWYGGYELGEVLQTLLTNPCVIDPNSTTHVVRGGSYSAYYDRDRLVYSRRGSSLNAGLRLVLPKEPNITHSFWNRTGDYWAVQNSYPSESLSVSIPGESIDVGAPNEYTCEIVSGNNWERSGATGSIFQVPSTVTSVRTPASPNLTIDDLVLKLTKGINSFIYTIPGREVPVHYPLIIGSIPDASVITSDFNITNYWRTTFFSNNSNGDNNISEIHKTCSLSIVTSGTAYADNLSQFKVYASDVSQNSILTSNSSFENCASYLCICTMGTASIKYFGQELLECVQNNATVRISNDPWLVGAKIYITKNRICEDLTGLDVNITTE